MNSQITSKMRAGLTTAVMALVFFATASHAKAQEVRVQANVPFAFEDGQAHYGAGHYKISSENKEVLRLQGDHTSSFLMTGSRKDSPSSDAGKLVFHRIGDRYFLAEIWTPNSGTHILCQRSKAERHAMLAMNVTSSSNVELALLQMPR